MTSQYLRYWSIIVADDSGNGLELQDFNVRFVVHHGTYTFPHTADVYIYNLGQQTQARIAREFTKVQIKAGYAGNYGVIFQGSIKQVTTGRESATDGFTKVFAADGDALHNFGVVHRTLPAGYSQEQVWATLANAAKDYHPTAPLVEQPSGTQSPRGKVMYGLWRDSARDWADTNQQLVTVDNGVVTAMPLLAYKSGDAIVINPMTGMVGVPEQTEQGVAVTTLLNPAIMWGSRLYLDNSDITQAQIGYDEAWRRAAPGLPTPPFLADLSPTGYYKALAVDHVGETRGNPWYTQIICVALDPTGTKYARTPGTASLILGDPNTPTQREPGAP